MRSGASSRRRSSRSTPPAGSWSPAWAARPPAARSRAPRSADHASRPILCTRGYGLPPWTTPDTTVLCASYSGNTEETLACFESAGALGARRIVVTTGGSLGEQARAEGVPVIPMPAGFEPRAAIAYLLISALEVAALCGAGPRLSAEIDVTASHLEQLVARWGPDADEDAEPKALARELHGSVPVVAGAELTAQIAHRWKAQINENAGVPAFAAELPELDHNEIAGWLGADRFGPFSAVFLDDSDCHPRLRARIELTQRFIEPHAKITRVVSTRRLEPARARLLARALRRPALLLHGRARRHRPDAGAAA